MNLLITHKVTVDLANASGETPLFIAIRKNSDLIFKALMSAGANPNHRNILDQSPLAIAMRLEKEVMAYDLISAQADLSEKHFDSNQLISLFALACKKKYVNICFACIDASIDLSLESEATLSMALSLVLNDRYSIFFEKYIDKLIRAGANLPDLANQLRSARISLSFSRFLEEPRLDHLKSSHGFSELCNLLTIHKDSIEALKLFAACLEKSLRKIPNQAEFADQINSSIYSDSPHALCRLIRDSADLTSPFSRALAPINPWSDLPEDLKALVTLYSPLSRKRAYLQYSS